MASVDPWPTDENGEIACVPVRIMVCLACLHSSGAECHTPGCSYCWQDSPSRADMDHMLQLAHLDLHEHTPAAVRILAVDRQLEAYDALFKVKEDKPDAN